MFTRIKVPRGDHTHPRGCVSTRARSEGFPCAQLCVCIHTCARLRAVRVPVATGARGARGHAGVVSVPGASMQSPGEHTRACLR